MIEQSRTYKTRALQSRAAIEVYQGNFTEAIHFYTESFKTRPSMSEYIETIKAIAFIKAVEGFHNLALKDLESLVPILRHAEPFAYYDILNSYAVELAEAGRKDEARNVIKHVLASPFTFAYPEWQDTANDLKEPNRSFISVPLIKREQIKVKQPATKEAKLEQPAKIISFPQLKEAPEPKIPEQVSPQELRDLSLEDKRELILATFRTSQMNDFEYDKFIVSLGLLKSGPADEVLDLEDKQILSDIVSVWANHIEPDQLAGVLSALRDCEDNMRRIEIIDKMIRIAFEYAQLCGLTEEAWRLRVERRLPKK